MSKSRVERKLKTKLNLDADSFKVYAYLSQMQSQIHSDSVFTLPMSREQRKKLRDVFIRHSYDKITIGGICFQNIQFNVNWDTGEETLNLYVSPHTVSKENLLDNGWKIVDENTVHVSALSSFAPTWKVIMHYYVEVCSLGPQHFASMFKATTGGFKVDYKTLGYHKNHGKTAIQKLNEMVSARLKADKKVKQQNAKKPETVIRKIKDKSLLHVTRLDPEK